MKVGVSAFRLRCNPSSSAPCKGSGNAKRIFLSLQGLFQYPGIFAVFIRISLRAPASRLIMETGCVPDE